MHDPRPSVPGSFTTDEAWQHIEAQLDEIAELARSQQSVVQFHQELLERLLRMLAAAGGAIWVREASGGWKAECQIRLESIFLGLGPSAEVRHAGLLQQVVRTGQVRSIAPHAGDEHAGEFDALADRARPAGGGCRSGRDRRSDPPLRPAWRGPARLSAGGDRGVCVGKRLSSRSPLAGGCRARVAVAAVSRCVGRYPSLVQPAGDGICPGQ